MNPSQMGKVRMADAKAAYFQTRLQWADITRAKLQGSGIRGVCTAMQPLLHLSPFLSTPSTLLT